MEIVYESHQGRIALMKIQYKQSELNVNTKKQIEDMKTKCPKFFSDSNRHFFGDHTYFVHKGQLIIRQTKILSDGIPKETFIVYLFLQDNAPYMFCVSTGKNLKTKEEAENLINQILDTKKVD